MLFATAKHIYTIQKYSFFEREKCGCVELMIITCTFVIVFLAQVKYKSFSFLFNFHDESLNSIDEKIECICPVNISKLSKFSVLNINTINKAYHSQD